MIRIFKQGLKHAMAIIGVLFTVIPEKFFSEIKIFPEWSPGVDIIINRVIAFLVIYLLTSIGFFLYLKFRKEVVLKEKNYRIRIKYGDIFDFQDYKKVIPFDECFTTQVGTAIADINPDSLCGQYLKKYPINNMNQLINDTGLFPTERKSSYNQQDCYESGKLIPRDDYLLMAFARLDAKGAGVMSREEYFKALSILWEELDLYFGQKMVCIPILGSGVTRIGDNELRQQELLNIIISSYKFSCHKIKVPSELCIVCRKVEGFSLDEY